MGDIAFLLIIFFMLTSNFIKEAHIELTPPAAPELETLETTPVAIAVDRDGIVWLQGKECPPSLVENAVEALIEDKRDKTVTLRVDKDLPHGSYGSVIMALSRAGAEIAMIGTKTGDDRP